MTKKLIYILSKTAIITIKNSALCIKKDLSYRIGLLNKTKNVIIFLRL